MAETLTLHPSPETLNPILYTLHPITGILDIKPYTLNPEP